MSPVAKRPLRQLPVRRARHRRSAPRRRHIRWRTRLLLLAAFLVAAAFAWAFLARKFAPQGNTSASRFDTIILLGARLDRDGNPSPVLLSRITESEREYERGVAPRIIVTGGEERGHVEADVMARVLRAQGVPASAIVLEPVADNTIQNACFSARIMKAHGWTSAEVVSSPSHLPRAGLIFSRTPIQWRTHAAPSLQPQSALHADLAASDEVMHTVYYLLFSSWAESCSP